jgi:hypothetical protein
MKSNSTLLSEAQEDNAALRAEVEKYSQMAFQYGAQNEGLRAEVKQADDAFAICQASNKELRAEVKELKELLCLTTGGATVDDCPRTKPTVEIDALRTDVERLKEALAQDGGASLKFYTELHEREMLSLHAEVERLTNVEIAHGHALHKLTELRAEVERLTQLVFWGDEKLSRIAELEEALEIAHDLILQHGVHTMACIKRAKKKDCICGFEKKADRFDEIRAALAQDKP